MLSGVSPKYFLLSLHKPCAVDLSHEGASNEHHNIHIY